MPTARFPTTAIFRMYGTNWGFLIYKRLMRVRPVSVGMEFVVWEALDDLQEKLSEIRGVLPYEGNILGFAPRVKVRENFIKAERRSLIIFLLYKVVRGKKLYVPSWATKKLVRLVIRKYIKKKYKKKKISIDFEDLEVAGRLEKSIIKHLCLEIVKRWTGKRFEYKEEEEETDTGGVVEGLGEELTVESPDEDFADR